VRFDLQLVASARAAKVEMASVQTARMLRGRTMPAPSSSAPTTPPAPTTPLQRQRRLQRHQLQRQRRGGGHGACPRGLSADEKTWISISSDGKNVFANSLEAHETKIVEASEKVRVLVAMPEEWRSV